jgi:hypothetical protein
VSVTSSGTASNAPAARAWGKKACRVKGICTIAAAEEVKEDREEEAVGGEGGVHDQENREHEEVTKQVWAEIVGKSAGTKLNQRQERPN